MGDLGCCWTDHALSALLVLGNGGKPDAVQLEGEGMIESERVVRHGQSSGVLRLLGVVAARESERRMLGFVCYLGCVQSTHCRARS